MCDLEVIIQSDLKFTLQCHNVIKKAHYLLKNIFDTFKHDDYEFYRKNCPQFRKEILTGLSLYKGNLQGVLLIQKIYHISTD